MPELKTVKRDLIRIPEVRVSSQLDPEQQAFLHQTVQAVGVVQDIVVRPLADGSFELVAGRSRLQELTNSGQQEIPVKVVEADEKTGLILNITENLARGSFDYVSVSRAIRRLRTLGASQDELTRIFPWTPQYLEFLEGLQDLPEDVLAAVQKHELTPTHIRLALQLPTPAEAHAGLRSAQLHGWNTQTFKIYVDNRIQEVKAAHARAQQEGIPPTVPPPQPEQLIQYLQCLGCGYKKPRQSVTLQQICEDCLRLVKYVVDQTAQPPEQAIETVYHGLHALYQPRPPQTSTTPTPPAPAPG